MANKKFKVLFKKKKTKNTKKEVLLLKINVCATFLCLFFHYETKKNIIWNHLKSFLGENFYIILNFK